MNPITTLVVKIEDPASSENDLRVAGQIIASGGLVVFPTETVYGLGADALNPKAVEKIFVAKGRPQDNPLIVHIHDSSVLDILCTDIPLEARKLAKRFWPGPLTMILKKKDIVPEVVSAGLDTVAVRMPSHPVALKLIEYSGTVIAAPSANLSGSPSTTEAQHVIRDLTGKVDMIIDAGECSIGVESTVISLAGPIPILLRPGAVTPEEIQNEIGTIEIDKAVFSQLEQGRKVSSPGLKYKHYSPKARVILIEGTSEQFADYVNRKGGENVFALCRDNTSILLNVRSLQYGNTSQEQAKMLFSSLRKLDDLGAETVYAQAPDKNGIGLAVYNRLLRAAGFERVIL